MIFVYIIIGIILYVAIGILLSKLFIKIDIYEDDRQNTEDFYGIFVWTWPIVTPFLLFKLLQRFIKYLIGF